MAVLILLIAVLILSIIEGQFPDVTIQVRQKGELYQSLVRASEVPNQAKTVQWLTRGLTKLESPKQPMFMLSLFDWGLIRSFLQLVFFSLLFSVPAIPATPWRESIKQHLC